MNECWLDDKDYTTCGLEIHYAARSRPDYMRGDAPSHLHCDVIGEPCWHDGTSLYAEETLWPRIKPLMKAGDHKSIFRIIEDEYDRNFSHVETDTKTEEETVSQE